MGGSRAGRNVSSQPCNRCHGLAALCSYLPEVRCLRDLGSGSLVTGTVALNSSLTDSLKGHNKNVSISQCSFFPLILN